MQPAIRNGNSAAGEDDIWNTVIRNVRTFPSHYRPLPRKRGSSCVRVDPLQKIRLTPAPSHAEEQYCSLLCSPLSDIQVPWEVVVHSIQWKLQSESATVSGLGDYPYSHWKTALLTNHDIAALDSIQNVKNNLYGRQRNLLR